MGSEIERMIAIGMMIRTSRESAVRRRLVGSGVDRGGVEGVAEVGEEGEGEGEVGDLFFAISFLIQSLRGSVAYASSIYGMRMRVLNCIESYNKMIFSFSFTGSSITSGSRMTSSPPPSPRSASVPPILAWSAPNLSDTSEF